MKKGRLFVISGPSGTGKGTICNHLMRERSVALSVSMTTRAPRPGEKEGFSYYFVSEERFCGEIAEGGLLEYAEVYGHLYGTPKAAVRSKLDAGVDVILEIDVQGALQIKKNYDCGVLIFILPPSMDELRRRIEGRRSESREHIEKRLGQAIDEMEYIGSYDYYVVNNDVDEAVKDIIAIMDAERHRVLDATELIECYKNERKEC
jgi:guanylate kinase